ncbi:hypothetical protein OC845_006026 [Tilletia horrida]|nr:hypothetical protein OC845_006026 [Tilletia horrida]
MSSFPDWPGKQAADDAAQGQPTQSEANLQGTQRGSNELHSDLSLLNSHAASSSQVSQDPNLMELFPDIDPGMIAGALDSVMGSQLSSTNQHVATSTSLFLSSDITAGADFTPAFLNLAQSDPHPSSQHYPQAAMSMHLHPHQQQQQQQQQPHQQPYSHPSTQPHLYNPHSQTDSASAKEASSQFPHIGAVSGTQGVPGALFAEQYPGLLYGATATGSQSTLADTSFESFMFNSQEQSFSSLTSQTSQSVPGSQESQLGPATSYSSLKDAVSNASSIMFSPDPVAGGSDGTQFGQFNSNRPSMTSISTPQSGSGSLTQTAEALSLASQRTPPQQSSFDTTIAGDGSAQDETQTTPQSHTTQTQLQITDSTVQRESQSPASAAQLAAQTHQTQSGTTLSTPTGTAAAQSGDLNSMQASSQFLPLPGAQAPNGQTQQSGSFSSQQMAQWQAQQAWIQASGPIGVEHTSMSGAMMPPPLSSSPASINGSGVSPTGSSRPTFDSQPHLRGRSSTISVGPELHVPIADNRPRSSTSSAGSNVYSFTPPVPNNTGMSRTNSSVSLAVFQPLEQLHISGGRPGTGGSVSSQHSGHMSFQRPGSGGYPTVPNFGSSQLGSLGGQQVPGHLMYGAVTNQHAGMPITSGGRVDGFGGADASKTGPNWQANNRLGVATNNSIGGNVPGRKITKLRRAPSNLTLDSGYSSSMSNTSFSPISYGLPSANTSEASPQFDQFPSVPSSATSSNALTAAGMSEYGGHHYGHSFGPQFGHASFSSPDTGVSPGAFTPLGPGVHLGDLSQSALSNSSTKAPGSGYQTPTILEEDESKMMNNVVSMGLIPAQLSQTMSSLNGTPSMPSGLWGNERGMLMDAGPGNPPGHPYVGNGQPSLLNPNDGTSAGPLITPHASGHPQSASLTPVVSNYLQPVGPQRSGPSVIVRYGGQQQQQQQSADQGSQGGSDQDEGSAGLHLQPSTLHHAVPISMATKYGPSGIPVSITASGHFADFKAYLRDQICEYLATPSRLGLGERTVTIMTAKVGPKSYGSEKRFLCPPPLVMLSGSSWWTADPNKLLPPAGDSSRSANDQDPSQKRKNTMSRLVPPTVSIKMVAESATFEGAMQWCSSDGSLLDAHEDLDRKIPVAGRCLARQLHISENSDDRRKPVHATVSISLPGPERPLELGTFSSGPIKVISKAFRKRQGVRNTDQSILHGSTVSLFHRLKSQTLSTRFLCVSGPPTWLKGTDGRPFLKSSISHPTMAQPENNSSFVVRTDSWDSFVIYAVDPTVAPDAVSQQSPLNPRYPTPPANAKPLRVDGEAQIPIQYNQPIVLQCLNTGVTSPIMTIRAVEHSRIAVGGLPLRPKSAHSAHVPESLGEPVSHNHRIALEILDENGENAVEPWVEGDPKNTPGRSGQFLACLQDAVGLRLCGPRKWLPLNGAGEMAGAVPPPTGMSITDADQPRSAAPMGGGSTSDATSASFLAAMAAVQTRQSLSASRCSNNLAAPSGPPSSAATPAERPSSSDGGKVKRPRRVSSSAVLPKDRTASAGRGRRRGQSLSTVGLGLHEPVESHLSHSASSTNLRGAAANAEGPGIAVGAGCQWMIDVADSDVWSIVGTEQVHHAFFIPPMIQNGYLPPAVDLGPELSHLVRAPTPKRPITPLPVLTNWAHSTTAHLGANFDPNRETVELHGNCLSADYFVFFGDWESEVIDATSWRLVCTPPPVWDDNGVRRSEVPVTLVRNDGIIIPTSLTVLLKDSSQSGVSFGFNAVENKGHAGGVSH